MDDDRTTVPTGRTAVAVPGSRSRATARELALPRVQRALAALTDVPGVRQVRLTARTEAGPLAFTSASRDASDGGRPLVLPLVAGRHHDDAVLTLAGDQPGAADLAAGATLLGLLLDSELERHVSEVRADRAAAEAQQDPLTGLGNRRRWETAVVVEASRAQRVRRSLAVVVVDLNQLKTVNDRHGHARGDDLLRTAAAVLGSAQRATDTACRLGGDEFGVLALVRDEADGEALAARLRAALRQAGVEAAVGVAVGRPEGERDVEELWQRADGEMYRHKRAAQQQPRPPV